MRHRRVLFLITGNTGLQSAYGRLHPVLARPAPSGLVGRGMHPHIVGLQSACGRLPPYAGTTDPVGVIGTHISTPKRRVSPYAGMTDPFGVIGTGIGCRKCGTR